MSFKQQLQDEGWFVARQVLSPADIEVALNRLRQVARHIEGYDRLPHAHRAEAPELANHADPLFRFEWIDGITFYDQPLWKHVAAHPALLEIAREVVGEQVFPLNGGGVFLKPPGSDKSVPWHQDASPFAMHPVDGHATNPLLFDFWLGLTPATREMGCLRLIPGSQHRGRLEHKAAGGILPQLDIHALGYSDRDIVSVETGPGDVIVWHQDMIHGSEPNRSSRSRVAVASVYHGQAEEQSLREVHRKGANRRRPQLCDGDRILPLDDPITPPWQAHPAP